MAEPSITPEFTRHEPAARLTCRRVYIVMLLEPRNAARTS
jgi:hypothetical protein